MSKTSKTQKFEMADPSFNKKDIKFITKHTKEMLNIALSMGKNVRKFEKNFAKYIGCKYAIATSSCTAALEIAVQSVCKEGDEVIIPSQTFIATAMAVKLSKLNIKFVEISENDFCIDFNDLKKKVSTKTKAVILVNFAGTVSGDFDKIKKFCLKKKLFLIEDAAHSIGAEFNKKKSGVLADIGCFSFYPTKIITSGEGGMLTTNNKKIADFAKSLQYRGRDLNSPSEIYINKGRNIRMQEFSAILGLLQLTKINSFLKRRKQIAKIYKKNLSNNPHTKLVFPKNFSNSSFWKIPILIDIKFDRNKVLKKLRKKGIMADLTYNPPVHLQPIIKKLCGTKKNLLPKTERLLKQHICLPCHQNMNFKDVEYISKSFLTILNEGF